MDTPLLADDVSAFLRLLDAHGVEYLLVGGYAVGVPGSPRATTDLDLRVARCPENAARQVATLSEFGVRTAELSDGVFLSPARDLADLEQLPDV